MNAIPEGKPEHLLLAPLGEHPGAVLGLLYWLNDRRRDPAPPGNIPEVTDLWIVTTHDPAILKRLKVCDGMDPGLLYELEKLKSINPARIVAACRAGKGSDRCIQDIHNETDHQDMTEVLYRLVLQAEGWRDRNPTGRLVSVAISGGRKTMSAMLETAAFLLTVDHVMHLVYDGDEKDSPQSLQDIHSEWEKHKLHPVVTRGGRIREGDRVTAWRLWTGELWNWNNPDKELSYERFPLDDDWTEGWKPPEGYQGYRSVAPRPADGSKDGPNESLVAMLDELAGGGAAGHTIRALAGSIGSRFLSHDLYPLLVKLTDSDKKNNDLWAVRTYVEGLEELVEASASGADDSAVLSRCDVSKIPELCDLALRLVSADKLRDGTGHGWLRMVPPQSASETDVPAHTGGQCLPRRRFVSRGNDFKAPASRHQESDRQCPPTRRARRRAG